MKRKEKLRLQREQNRERMRARRGVAVVYYLLRGIVIAALVLSALRRDYESMFFCALTLILFLLPAFVERNFRVRLPDTLEIVILFFIFATQILGELSAWYVRFQGWDTLMHTTNGFLCAAIGFSLVGLFNRSERFEFSLSPIYLAIVAFCFSMTIAVLWEFFEFAMDRFLLMDMQKDTIVHTISSVALSPAGSNRAVVISGIEDVVVNGQSLGLGGYLDIGLYDTMKDLFVNFVGALVFSIIGYFYVKSSGKGKFASRFIPVVLDEEKTPDETESPDGDGAPDELPPEEE